MNDQTPNSNRRLYVLGGLLSTILLAYICVMYSTQIVHGAEYQERSVRTITSSETVEASRGILTDRNGQVLVSNRQTYALTFDTALLGKEDDVNAAILRLIQLCRARGVDWDDNLPISAAEPYVYTMDDMNETQRIRFLRYLQKRGLLTAAATAGDLTNALLNQMLPAGDLLAAMAGENDFQLPADWSRQDLRAVVGVRYELEIRSIMWGATSYVFAEDVDSQLISLIKDGNYLGVKVFSSSVREYDTTAAAHVLGRVGRIDGDELKELKEQGYGGNDWIGKEGAELAFEDYLRGTDGTRVISSNAEGKVTSEIYTTEPKPGNTVALTIDLNLQQATEAALEKTITAMAKDGNVTRGAGAAVIKIGTGEVLSLASYPTFNLATYVQDYNTLQNDPSNPYFNRATQGTYAPGSTFKPVTAVAALEEGVITPATKIRDTGKWYYPGASTGDYTYCWNHSGHGLVNVTQAINVSCNYFFAEMGYRLGLDRLNAYATAFGLGVKTGIEVSEKAGNLAAGQGTEDLAPWAAYGQADYLFTPLQLANYTATLSGGGQHYQAHLLKSVKTFDNAEVVFAETPTPMNTIAMSDSTLTAVKEGMHDLTTTGSLAGYFRRCVVDAGAKTGTAQINKVTKNNGVFICFAPFDDPQVALAIVIEEGGTGSALASTAVEILNAYFTQEDIGGVILPENQLLP